MCHYLMAYTKTFGIMMKAQKFDILIWILNHSRFKGVYCATKDINDMS